MSMASGLYVHARIEQRRDVLCQCLRAAQVRNRDLCPAPPEEECRRKTRHSQPDNENLPAFELHERELNGNLMGPPFRFSRDSLASKAQNADNACQNQSHAGKGGKSDWFT